MIGCNNIFLKNEMIVITKTFRTFVSQRNLILSSRKVHCSLKEVPFSLGNLGPSTRKIHYSLGKLYFSPRNFFYSMGILFGIGTYSKLSLN